MNKEVGNDASDLDSFFGNDMARNGEDRERDGIKNNGNERKESTRKSVTGGTETTDSTSIAAGSIEDEYPEVWGRSSSVTERSKGESMLAECEVFGRRDSIKRTPPQGRKPSKNREEQQGRNTKG